MGNSRFGVKEYADPNLLETSRQSSPTAGSRKFWRIWMADFFKTNSESDFWEGTPVKLLMDIEARLPVASRM